VFASLRGLQFYYDIQGEGVPVVMLPGGPGGDHHIYRQTHRHLADQFQLIYFDPRGCGQSESAPIETYDIDNYVEDVEALRKFLKLKKLNVIGKSYGGIIAQAYALKYPDSIEKLILVATAPSFHFLEEAMINLKASKNPEQIAIGIKLLSGDFKDQEEVDSAFLKMRSLYSDAQKSKTMEEIRETNTVRMYFEPLTYGFKTFLKTFNFQDQLPMISNKTLVIGGDHDWCCDVKYTQLLHSKIPGSEMLILKAGHSVDLDQPEIYFSNIREFLR
jgi:proline iminopeptidase